MGGVYRVTVLSHVISFHPVFCACISSSTSLLLIVKANYGSPVVAVSRRLAPNLYLIYYGAGSRLQLRIASNLSFPYDQISFIFCRVLTIAANATGLGGWKTALSQAQSFVDQLTTEEKFTIVTGTAG